MGARQDQRNLLTTVCGAEVDLWHRYIHTFECTHTLKSTKEVALILANEIRPWRWHLLLIVLLKLVVTLAKTFLKIECFFNFKSRKCPLGFH